MIRHAAFGVSSFVFGYLVGWMGNGWTTGAFGLNWVCVLGLVIGASVLFGAFASEANTYCKRYTRDHDPI